jgi:hypothetical protein
LCDVCWQAVDGTERRQNNMFCCFISLQVARCDELVEQLKSSVQEERCDKQNNVRVQIGI